MKNIIWILIVLLLPCQINNIILAQQPSKTEQSLDNGYVTDLNLALKLSKETKQKVVLIFSADWCGYCKVLKKDLPNIKEFDDKIICVLDSDDKPELSKQFKIKSLPTSIMLNNEGKEISRITGYKKDSYTKWLESQK